MPNFIPNGHWELVDGHTGLWRFVSGNDLTIFGSTFSIEAIEVEKVGDIHVAVDPKCAEHFVYVQLLSNIHGLFSTVEIGGKTAVAVFMPTEDQSV